MAKDAIVSEELAKKFATEKDTPYLRWVRGEGLDVISAHYVRNLRTVELKPWARRGGAGARLGDEHAAAVVHDRILHRHLQPLSLAGAGAIEQRADDAERQ